MRKKKVNVKCKHNITLEARHQLQCIYSVAQTSRYLYVVLSAGITPFFPPASTTMLHNVIRSSIYPKGSNYQKNIFDQNKISSEFEKTLS